MKFDVKDISGKKVKTVDLPEDIFGRELNDHVLHTVVKAYQANRRQGTHATKTRSTVAGTGKKPFKQKGTGNARQGTTRSPHHPGGAVSHGPQPRSYRQKTNKKLRALALKVAISDRVRHGAFHIVDDLGLDSFSTKRVVTALKVLGAEKALIVDERKDLFLAKSTSNIYQSGAANSSSLNAEDVLRHQNLVVSENGLNSLIQRLGGSKE